MVNQTDRLQRRQQSTARTAVPSWQRALASTIVLAAAALFLAGCGYGDSGYYGHSPYYPAYGYGSAYGGGHHGYQRQYGHGRHRRHHGGGHYYRGGYW